MVSWNGGRLDSLTHEVPSSPLFLHPTQTKAVFKQDEGEQTSLSAQPSQCTMVITEMGTKQVKEQKMK